MQKRPRQAVILAGGRGVRLLPLTRLCPKPMIQFHGRPFLAYLIEMLRDQGFERVLLLLGYMPDSVIEYFGNGSEFGVHICYSVSDPDHLTSRRLQLASDLIDPQFLLMYCDNYWPMQFDRMWTRFRDSQVAAMVTVYSNEDGYSKNCVRVGEDGKVQQFDRSRKAPGLQGVELSYAILDKSVLDLLPVDEMLFEEAVYPTLAARGQLLAYVTHHRYYGVGSHDRLPVTDAFLARVPTVILDRDGVLNYRPPKAEYVRTANQFHWLPGAQEALKLFREAGYRVIVASNQAGISRGALTEHDLGEIHDRMKDEALASGGRIDAIFYCPHGWDEGCDCRKPKPGLLFRAQRDFHLDLTRTLFVGDDERDATAAESAGCPYAAVSEDTSLLDIARHVVSGTASADLPLEVNGTVCAYS